MSLFARARTLMSANFHDWLDRRQSPESLARQGLRELHAATQAALSATAQLIVAERLLQRQHDDQLSQLEPCERRAAAALDAGDESLARQLLGQKYRLVQTSEQTARRLAELSTVNQQLRGEIQRLRERYAHAREKLAVDGARLAAATAVSRLAEPGQSLLPPGEMDLEHELERVERAALAAEVQCELRGEPSRGLEAELQHHEEERFVQAELARLRAGTRE